MKQTFGLRRPWWARLVRAAVGHRRERARRRERWRIARDSIERSAPDAGGDGGRLCHDVAARGAGDGAARPGADSCRGPTVRPGSDGGAGGRPGQRPAVRRGRRGGAPRVSVAGARLPVCAGAGGEEQSVRAGSPDAPSAAGRSRWVWRPTLRAALARRHCHGHHRRHRLGHDQQRGRPGARRPAARLRGGRRSHFAVIRGPGGGRPAAGRQGGQEPVGAGPGTHHQVDQAQDGPGREGPARRSGISAAGNLGHDPARAARPGGGAAGPAGEQGGHHGAGLLQRRPAAGHARGRRAGRPGSGAHPQRADGRVADLRSQPPARCAA